MMLSRATLVGVLLLASAGGSSVPASAHRAPPAPVPLPAPTANPAVTATARRQFLDWQLGSVDTTRYTSELASAATPAVVSKTGAELGRLGSLLHFQYVGSAVAAHMPPGASGYIYRAICASGKVYMLLALDPKGKIARILYADNLRNLGALHGAMPKKK